MLIYWLMFLAPAAFAMVSGLKVKGGSAGKLAVSPAWLFAAACLIVLIGWRYQVGGDWFTYLGYLNHVSYQSFQSVITLSDPGFMILNWVSVRLGWGVVGVNVLSAMIFTAGLIVFCHSLPRPWLALTVAIPYLVVVVGMGYTRQGIAISLAMIGFVSLARGSTLKYIIWILLAAAFHKTAIILIPIVGLAKSTRGWQSYFWLLIVIPVSYFAFLAESIDHLYESYIVNQYQSQGALIRLLMNAIPAMIFLLRRDAFVMKDKSIWTIVSYMSVVLLVAFFFLPISTALDRIALYAIPLQMVVFSHLPSLFEKNGEAGSKPIVFLIIIYYSMVFATWLIFANHSQYWLPYRSSFFS